MFETKNKVRMHGPPHLTLMGQTRPISDQKNENCKIPLKLLNTHVKR